MAAEFAVETWGLTKTFRGPPPGDQRAWTDAIVDGVKHLFRPLKQKTVVDGISVSIRRGEFFGIIGSNGAGKTTFLKLLNCMLYPDAGAGRVNGHDLLRDRAGVRRSSTIALAGGYLGLLWQLTGRQNLLFRARLCGLPAAEAAAAVDYVLERLEVAHRQHEHSWNWSAGERQKFGLALAFVGRTPLVMLDEPTSHLDPRTARLIREFVRGDLNRHNGQTVVMCTHYLEEADQLCDRVAVFYQGRILACDTPARLKRDHAPERILELRATNYAPEIGERVRRACGLAELLEHFEDVTTGRVRLRPQWAAGNGTGNSSGTGDRLPEAAAALREALEAEQVTVTDVRQVAPTMDDVYFRLAKERLT